MKSNALKVVKTLNANPGSTTKLMRINNINEYNLNILQKSGMIKTVDGVNWIIDPEKDYSRWGVK
jgi:hypothetical protein